MPIKHYVVRAWMHNCKSIDVGVVREPVVHMRDGYFFDA